MPEPRSAGTLFRERRTGLTHLKVGVEEHPRTGPCGTRQVTGGIRKAQPIAPYVGGPTTSANLTSPATTGSGSI